MNPITGNVLIDFNNMPGSKEEIDYHKQVYGAIKLDLTQMQKYEKTSHFNQCKNSNCRMVLTIQDKACVYDWEEISSNEIEFKEVLDQCREDQDKVVWICSFCQTKNVLEPAQVRFARNNSRVIQRPALSGQKKDPILLIVFDISGSMQEVLVNDQSAYSTLVQRIKKTKIYQKIVAQQEGEITQLCQKQNIKIESDPKLKYKDYLKKNKLLMGLTQTLIMEINASASEKRVKQNSFSSNKKAKVTKSIGFVFFNSYVIIDPVKADKSGRVIICDNHGTFSGRAEGMSRERVNFDDFESLFKLGSNYGAEYETKINQMNFGNMDFNFGDCSSGQTALGPAIVVAAGVVSQHGAGSSIVVVTDGIGNKGIFDQSQKWQQPLKLLKMRLQKHKCFLAMFQCRNIDQNNRERDSNNIKTCIDQFCLKYQDSVTRKINCLLSKNKTADHLVDDIKNKMTKIINRDNAIWTNKVRIRAQNQCVSFEEDEAKLAQKLHSNNKSLYIHPKIDHTKLKQKDYMHHFMTQAVIRYENTQNGQQSTFMTYVLQKFIKYNSLRKQTIKKFDNEKTLHDMLQYLSAQQQNYDISNMSLGFVKKTFRDTLMFSRSICNRSMRFPGNTIETDRSQQANFFEQLYRRNAELTIREAEREQEEENAL